MKAGYVILILVAVALIVWYFTRKNATNNPSTGRQLNCCSNPLIQAYHTCLSAGGGAELCSTFIKNCSTDPPCSSGTISRTTPVVFVHPLDSNQGGATGWDNNPHGGGGRPRG